jgi:hypothetical protein
MKCAHAEELLPLYVHSDLDDGRAADVRSHLQSCGHCRQLAAEFKEVGQWMSLHEPPHFSDELFRSIRRNVLEEINSGAAKPGFAQQLAAFFQRRATAVAFAVLLIAGTLFAFNLYTERRGGAGQDGRAQVEVAGGGTAGGGASEPSRPAAVPSVPVATPAVASTPQRVARVSGTPARARNVSSKVARAVRPSAPPATEVVAAVGGAGNLARTPEASGEVTVDGGVKSVQAASAQGAVRLELRTGDPNIRIIWFASQPRDVR